jgi:hypothetical protein
VSFGSVAIVTFLAYRVIPVNATTAGFASEFDDFSSCWGNDRYKAQGLVAQIQKLVNVKDSFTRINLEREKERKQRQAVYTAGVQEKQKEAQERATIKDSLYKLFSETDPYQAGKAT